MTVKGSRRTQKKVADVISIYSLRTLTGTGDYFMMIQAIISIYEKSGYTTTFITLSPSVSSPIQIDYVSIVRKYTRRALSDFAITF